jgi:hypothetical protein
MKTTSYVKLTPAQESTLDALETVTVRTALVKPAVVATIRTFQAQEVKLTIDADGIIENVEVRYDSL